MCMIAFLLTVFYILYHCLKSILTAVFLKINLHYIRLVCRAASVIHRRFD